MHEDPIRPKPHFARLDLLDQSAIKGLYSQDITQYLKVTKFTIQKYLEACLHPEGQFREFFSRFAKFSCQYNINESIAEDPQVRTIQIARYFSRMRENPPQIFIQDGGYEYVPASLGSLTEGYNARTSTGEQIVRIMDVIQVPIEIVCAATDEQTIEDLAAILSAAFGQFQRFTCNYVLRPHSPEQGVYWEVRVPLKHQMGAKSHAALHGDPQAQLWQVTCSMTVEFENSTYIQYRSAPLYDHQSGSVSLSLPNHIPLSRITNFTVQHMPIPISVYSNDSRIAIITASGTSFTIRPKRLGTFKVLVTRQTGSTGHPLSAADAYIIAEKEVTVVTR